MNVRQRKKYYDYTNCSHRKFGEDILSYDPYFKQIKDYCKLGRYGLEDNTLCRCYNCRYFALSRREMKTVRELKKLRKRLIKKKSKLCFYSPYKEAREKEENERFSKLLFEI